MAEPTSDQPPTSGSSARKASTITTTSARCQSASRAAASHEAAHRGSLRCATQSRSSEATTERDVQVLMPPKMTCALRPPTTTCHDASLSTTNLSGTALPSSLLLWLALEGHLWSSLAVLFLLQPPHASSDQRVGPAVPGCCLSPGAASGSEGRHE